MKKLLIIDNKDRMLLSMDSEQGEDILIDNSIQIRSNKDGMVIRLLKDYGTEGNALVKIVDGEIMFEVDR